jgi:Zn-finger nucleic acid-binding protein
MRLLVACAKCQRQYDATDRAVGSRFRCRCGEVLTVNQPEGHDAAVVRCASCGAPRREGSQRCEFCNADFTLREQDLDTICPNCFARVSDHARFCDHCGKPLSAEPLSVADTRLVCPACRGDRSLFSRAIGGFGLLECHVCAGMWIENAIFPRLIDHARQKNPTGDEWLRTCFERKQSPTNTTENSSHGYLPCPVCKGLMLRQNYQHRSRVVIDVCKRHGVWFDADKLSRLLEWVHCGGLESAQIERDQAVAQTARIESALRSNHDDASTMPSIDARGISFWMVVAEVVASLFTRS